MSPVYDFIANSCDGVMAVDSQQTIVLWNDAAARILGYAADEVLGKQCFRVMQGRDTTGCAVCHRHCATFQRAERLENPPTAEVSSRTRDGQNIWLSVSTVLVPSRRRELATLIHFFREITHEHQLHDVVEEFTQVVAGISHPRGDGDSPAGLEHESDFKLTRRERQVLALLVSGVSGDTIAERLCISPRTVRNHVTNLLGKLGVHSRLEAVALAIRNGIV